MEWFYIGITIGCQFFLTWRIFKQQKLINHQNEYLEDLTDMFFISSNIVKANYMMFTDEDRARLKAEVEIAKGFVAAGLTPVDPKEVLREAVKKPVFDTSLVKSELDILFLIEIFRSKTEEFVKKYEPLT